MNIPDFIVVMLTLFYELGICDINEIRCGARVIQIRSEEGKSLLSYREICLQPKQFSCWNGSNKKKILREYQGGKTQASPNWAKVKVVMLELYRGDLDYLPCWNHYYNPDLCNPSWAKDMKQTRNMGYHIFGRIER